MFKSFSYEKISDRKTLGYRRSSNRVGSISKKGRRDGREVTRNSIAATGLDLLLSGILSVTLTNFPSNHRQATSHHVAALPHHRHSLRRTFVVELEYLCKVVFQRNKTFPEILLLSSSIPILSFLSIFSLMQTFTMASKTYNVGVIGYG